MIPRTLIYKISITLLLTITVAVLYSGQLEHRDYLDIAFLNVGQGDGAIIDIHNSNQKPIRIMIDTGRGEKTMQSIQNYFNKSVSDYLSTIINQSEIDTLMLTHNDDDHIGMRCTIINRYHVKKIIISDSMSTSSLLSCDKNKVIENKLNTNNSFENFQKDFITLNYVHTGDTISIRNINLKIFNPNKELNSETSQKSKTKNNSDNQKSIVVLLEAYNNKILFTGDIDKKVERQIINDDINKNNNLKNIDILKVAHHGSDGSSDPIFIKYTQPKVSIISVGKNNYGHPSPRVVDDLTAVSSTIHRTDQEGNVMFHFE